jgi:hypothetical protein
MPAKSTYTPIATTTVSGSSAATIDFNSIPQTYTDLVVTCYIRSTGAVTTCDLLYSANANTSNSYDGTFTKGNGASATSGRYTYFSSPTYLGPLGTMLGANATSGVFSSHSVNVQNYSNTTTYKTLVAQSASDNNGSGNSDLAVNMFFSTSAISRLTFYPSSGQFAIGSTMTIHGIEAA